MYIEHLFGKEKVIETEINTLRKELATLPAGKLTYERTGKYVKWFCSDGKISEYIPQKEKKLIQGLARRKYILAKIDDLKFEKKEIEYIRRKIEKKESQVDKLVKNKTFSELGLFGSLDSWCTEKYNKNLLYPENLKYKSLSGNCVRSKSEVFIDQALYLNNVSYRYECELKLGDYVFYPDFTILHPITKNLFYWEHFGMMDNAKYAQNVFNKQNIYCMNGIIPGIQLICTYETADSPFDMSKAEAVVNQYFI